MYVWLKVSSAQKRNFEQISRHVQRSSRIARRRRKMFIFNWKKYNFWGLIALMYYWIDQLLLF